MGEELHALKNLYCLVILEGGQLAVAVDVVEDLARGEAKGGDKLRHGVASSWHLEFVASLVQADRHL